MKLPAGMSNPLDKGPRAGMTLLLPKWYDHTLRAHTFVGDDYAPFLVLTRVDSKPQWQCLSLSTGAVVSVSTGALKSAIERKNRLA